MNAKANSTPPRILTVGLPYRLPGTDWVEFYTDKHFLDYNIVIVDPRGALEGQTHEYKVYDGILGLDSDQGDPFVRRYNRATKKLAEFVNKGGLAIVFLRPMPTLRYIRIVTRSEQRISIGLDDFLPWEGKALKKAHGDNIEFMTQGPVGQFWTATNGLWSYEAVFDTPPKGPRIANVMGHPDEVVADFVETQGRGFTVVTPVLTCVVRPEDRQSPKEDTERFIQAVVSLHEALRTKGSVPQLPDWASDYSLPGEKELRDGISATNGQIEALQEQARQHTEALDDLSLHKLLVTGHDSALEGAVDRVLTELGMNVEAGPKGRVDRTATYGDRKFAVEVQGVKRGAKEDHARSLTIWVQEVAVKDGKEPKGLFVANPYRDTPLTDRNGNNFWPGETINICKRQGYCAITGLQLLGLYLDAMADETAREQLIDRLFNTEGVFEGYEDWRQFLVPVESKSPDES